MANPTRSVPVEIAAQWSPPPAGWHKVNVDGCFRVATADGASGVVIMNDQGEFVRAEARWYTNVSDALVAERHASRDGLKLALVVEFGSCYWR